MTSYTDLKVNPFDDVVVREPRDVLFSVQGLNDAPLNTLITSFAPLVAQPPPRAPVRAGKVQLLVSPDRGFGKSHLLGQLFRELESRATKVYLRPYQDPHKAWHSILLVTIKELQRPDSTASPGAPTQLQALAFATLARLAADVITAHGIPGRLEPADAIVLLLRKAAAGQQPLDAQVRHWIDWLAKGASQTHAGAHIVEELQRRGIDLGGREKAWVKVLAAHALAEPFSPRALAATKWLRAEPLELDDTVLLGLEEADNDCNTDSEPKETDALSLQRVHGLCLLASYHRPFVFCFDQTESYANDRERIKALGDCLEIFFAELPNHLTIITAGALSWSRDIAPDIEAPQLDRLSDPIELEGIRPVGARELITRRLVDCGLPDHEVAGFFADGWFDKLFPPGTHQRGVRNVLRLAAARFRELAAAPPPVTTPLEDLFQQEVNGVRSKEALQAYSQDALMWFVREVGRGLPGVSIERPSEHKYFSLQWILPKRTVSFTFEGGAHWKRWQAIAKEVLKTSHRNVGHTSLSYVFRTPDLEEVPRDSWKQAAPDLRAAEEHGLQIFELTTDQVCEIHGARELYSHALEGNIDYKADQTLAWLKAHFLPFLKELADRQLPPPGRGADKPQTSPVPLAPPRQQLPLPIELDAKSLAIVAEMVREHRVIDLQAVLDRLGRSSERDAVLRSVEKHPNLKAHPGPKTIYLQWRSAPSQPAS